MLQFVHSTVSRQPRIKHCVLLSSTSTPRVSFEVLLIYEKSADIIHAEVKDSLYDFKTIQTIPVEIPLRWIDTCNELIFSFTETNKLLILNNCNFKSSLSQIASIDFSFFLDTEGHTEDFQFFCFSNSKDFLLISSLSNHFFVVNISDPLNAEVRPFYLEENLTLIDVSISNDQDWFVFLVEIKEESSNNDQADPINQNQVENENDSQSQAENQNQDETVIMNTNNEEDENDENDNERSEDKEEEDNGNENDIDNENNTENDNENESDNDDIESEIDEEESDDDRSKKSKKKKQQLKKAKNIKKKQSQKKSHQIQKSTENNQNKKIRSNQKFIFFDAHSFSIVKTDPVYDDFVGFIPTMDPSRSLSLFVKKDSIEISSKHQVCVSSPVQIYSNYIFGIFACQLESNDILITGTDPKGTLIITDAPKFENMWILQNTVMLLTTYDKNYYIELQKIKKATNKKGSSAKSVQFKALKIIKEIELSPIPTFSTDSNFSNSCSLFFDQRESKLLFSTDSGLYRLSSDVHIETGKNKCKVDDTNSIFAPVSDVVIGSNDRETHVVYGEVDISKSPTVAVLYFASKHIQVHRDGINEFNDPLYECTSNHIICAASNGIRLVIGHDDGLIILFHSSFNEYDEMRIAGFTNLAICGTHFAVSEPSQISLFNFAMERFQAYQIPSYPISMVFVNYGRELYASLHCGAILRISENSVSYPCYFNKDPILLQTKESESSIFILDEFLYIYNHSRLIKTDLTNINAICSSYDEDEPLVLNICFLQKKRLFIIKYDETPYLYSFNKIKFEFYNPKLFEFCGNLYAFTSDLSHENDDEIESSMIIDFDSKKILIHIPEAITCFTINENHGYLFLAAGKSIYCITCLEDTLDVLYKIELENMPIALGTFYDSIVIGFNNEIKIADFQEKSLKFHNISLELVSPIKTIITNGFCWAILENSTIFTFIFDDKLDQFEIICYGHYNNSSFSQFCIIDSCTIAVVTDKTKIIFFRIPKRLSASSIDKHTFDVIGKFNAYQEISSLSLVGDAIIYVTADGSVHSLTCCNQDSKYRMMLSSQLKIRNEIMSLFSISEQSDDELWNQYNVVDSDILDTLKNQEHRVKNEQDIMNSILFTERQKIIFK